MNFAVCMRRVSLCYSIAVTVLGRDRRDVRTDGAAECHIFLQIFRDPRLESLQRAARRGPFGGGQCPAQVLLFKQTQTAARLRIIRPGNKLNDRRSRTYWRRAEFFRTKEILDGTY